MRAEGTSAGGSLRGGHGAVDFPEQLIAGTVEGLGGLQVGLSGGGAVECVERRALLEEAGGVRQRLEFL